MIASSRIAVSLRTAALSSFATLIAEHHDLMAVAQTFDTGEACLRQRSTSPSAAQAFPKRLGVLLIPALRQRQLLSISLAQLLDDLAAAGKANSNQTYIERRSQSDIVV